MGSFEAVKGTWVTLLKPASILTRHKVAYDFPDGPRKWKYTDNTLGLIMRRYISATLPEEVLLTMVNNESHFAVNGLRGWLPAHDTNDGVAIPLDYLEPYTPETADRLRQNPYTAGFPAVFEPGFKQVQAALVRLDGDGIRPQALGPYFRHME